MPYPGDDQCSPWSLNIDHSEEVRPSLIADRWKRIGSHWYGCRIEVVVSVDRVREGSVEGSIHLRCIIHLRYNKSYPHAYMFRQRRVTRALHMTCV